MKNHPLTIRAVAEFPSDTNPLTLTDRTPLVLEGETYQLEQKEGVCRVTDDEQRTLISFQCGEGLKAIVSGRDPQTGKDAVFMERQDGLTLELKERRDSTLGEDWDCLGQGSECQSSPTVATKALVNTLMNGELRMDIRMEAARRLMQLGEASLVFSCLASIAQNPEEAIWARVKALEQSLEYLEDAGRTDWYGADLALMENPDMHGNDKERIIRFLRNARVDKSHLEKSLLSFLNTPNLETRFRTYIAHMLGETGKTELAIRILTGAAQAVQDHSDHLAIAKELIRLKQNDPAAQAIYGAVLTVNPNRSDKLDLAYRLALLNPEKAAMAFTDYLEKEPRAFEMQHKVAEQLWEMGKRQEALSGYENILGDLKTFRTVDERPSDYSHEERHAQPIPLEAINRFIEAGDRRKAVELLKEMTSPTSPIPGFDWDTAAKLFSELGEEAEAIRVYEFLSTDGETFYQRLKATEKLGERGRKPEALKIILKMANKYGFASESGREAIALFTRLGGKDPKVTVFLRDEKAKQAIEKKTLAAKIREPQTPVKNLFETARQISSLDGWWASIPVYQKILNSPKATEAEKIEAAQEIISLTESWETEAQQAVNAVYRIGIRSSDGGRMLRLAQYLLTEKEKDKAIALLKRVVSKDHYHSDRMDAADALWESGEKTPALNAYLDLYSTGGFTPESEAIQYDSGFADQLAQKLLEIGKPEQAKQIYHALASNKGGHSSDSVRLKYADKLASAGGVKEAEALYGQLAPLNAEIACTVADRYAARGEKHRAVDLLISAEERGTEQMSIAGCLMKLDPARAIRLYGSYLADPKLSADAQKNLQAIAGIQ